MSICTVCHLVEPCGCTANASTSDSKSVSSDDRHFAVIQITLYDDARRERVIDTFGVNTWIPEEQFRILKEFFLETIQYTEIVEEIEMTTELMK